MDRFDPLAVQGTYKILLQHHSSEGSILHQTVCERRDVQAGFRKARGTRDQIANILWIIENSREFLKNIYFYFIDYAKAFDSVDHNKLWKILQEMGIPDHLTCLLRNLCGGQEATVRSEHGTTDWFQFGKGVYQGSILSTEELKGERDNLTVIVRDFKPYFQ